MNSDTLIFRWDAYTQMYMVYAHCPFYYLPTPL